MINPKILIVEDEMIIALDIQCKLQQCGYSDITTVPSGEKALKFIEKNKPNLILMDIKLSGYLDGIDTSRQIQLIYKPAIIFLSAYSDPIIKKRADAVHPAGYLTKACSEDDMIRTIDQVVTSIHQSK